MDSILDSILRLIFSNTLALAGVIIAVVALGWRGISLYQSHRTHQTQQKNRQDDLRRNDLPPLQEIQSILADIPRESFGPRLGGQKTPKALSDAANRIKSTAHSGVRNSVQDILRIMGSSTPNMEKVYSDFDDLVEQLDAHIADLQSPNQTDGT